MRKFGNSPPPPPPHLHREGFVAQPWSWMASLISYSKLRVYGPKRLRHTPKGVNAGLGEAALVNTGKYLHISQ